VAVTGTGNLQPQPSWAVWSWVLPLVVVVRVEIRNHDRFPDLEWLPGPQPRKMDIAGLEWFEALPVGGGRNRGDYNAIGRHRVRE